LRPMVEIFGLTAIYDSRINKEAKVFKYFLVV
jgi:hypothetical protein